MKPRSTCQNCGKTWPDSDLLEIEDLEQRVEAGEPMPSGECPECGALCQPGAKRIRKPSVFIVLRKTVFSGADVAYVSGVFFSEAKAKARVLMELRRDRGAKRKNAMKFLGCHAKYEIKRFEVGG